MKPVNLEPPYFGHTGRGLAPNRLRSIDDFEFVDSLDAPCFIPRGSVQGREHYSMHYLNTTESRE